MATTSQIFAPTGFVQVPDDVKTWMSVLESADIAAVLSAVTRPAASTVICGTAVAPPYAPGVTPVVFIMSDPTFVSCGISEKGCQTMGRNRRSAG
jgi:hypothetical protein